MFNPKETEGDEIDEPLSSPAVLLDPNLLQTPSIITEEIQQAELTYFEKLCHVRVSQFGRTYSKSDKEIGSIVSCAASADSKNFALSTSSGSLLVYTSANLKLKGVGLPGKSYTSMELYHQNDLLVCHNDQSTEIFALSEAPLSSEVETFVAEEFG